MITIENHLIKKGPTVKHVSCPKNTVLFKQGQPDTIVLHYTAGRDGKSSASYLAKEKIKASAHIVVDRTGDIYQLVPFNKISWHAGKSSYEGRIGFNNFSIGIEIDNAGILEKSGDKYISWFGKKYEEEDVIKARHKHENVERFWHTYTEIQLSAVEELCELLLDQYSTVTQIVGHEDIARGRKKDPGPAFPMEKLRSLLLESREETISDNSESEGFVDVSQLNIREMPSVNAELVSAPLSEGTRVKVLQKINGWYKVEATVEGWVSGEYVKLTD